MIVRISNLIVQSFENTYFLQIRLDYQTNIRDSTLINGAMHWQIHYVNDVSRPTRNENHIDEEHFRHMAESKRWELKLRNIQYR